MRRGLLEDRFWRKVNKDGPIPAHAPELGPCWVWTGGTRGLGGPGRGYGHIWDGERLTAAHRLALSWALGRPLGPGECALHHCDNKPCVRASHLYSGTHADNSRDMYARGRQGPRPDLHGEANPGAKLTAAQVLEIREFAAAGISQTKIAHAYGISDAIVSMIVHRHVWAHVGA